MTSRIIRNDIRHEEAIFVVCCLPFLRARNGFHYQRDSWARTLAGFVFPVSCVSMTNACQHCAHGFLCCSGRGSLTVGNSAGSNFNFFVLFAFQSMPVADSRALSAHLQGILSHELPPRPPHSYRLRPGYEGVWIPRKS